MLSGVTTIDPAVVVAVVNAAEQLVAFVDDQVSVEFCPLSIVVGFAVRVTVGSAGAVTVTVAVLVAD